jgi:WXG100 family type VII secretion target
MPDQQMMYDDVLDMAATFQAAAQQLDETMTLMAGIAAQMEGGGLVGDAGDEFADALNNKLKKSLQRLREKMEELDKDLRGAVDIMRDGVDTAESRFV